MDRRLLLMGALLAGCASGPGRTPAPAVTPEQKATMAKAERLYRANDPAFDSLRDELTADSASAYWLTRLFVRDLIWARDSRASNDTEFLNAAAGKQHPVEARALRHLTALGAAAGPAVVADLMKSQYSDRRELGAEVFAKLGPSAVPQLESMLADADRRPRRLAVAALAAMEKTPAVIARLEAAAKDAEFTVRSAAYAGLARSGAVYAPVLRAALMTDSDQFVRRVIVAELAVFRDRATAAAVFEYMSQCLEAGDHRGVRAADATLRKLSGRKKPGNLEVWRSWLAGLKEAR